MAYENIHAGHRKRLRERFLENGIESFLPHQMLELLLFYSMPREDTNVYAHRLLNKFGNLEGVFNASVDELCEVSGIGENTALLIKIIPQFCGILDGFRVERVSLASKGMICNYFNGVFKDVNDERIYLACLDDDLNLIKLVLLDFDKDRYSTDTLKDITKEVIKTNCTQCIIAVNHVNSYSTPTDKDTKFAKAIIEYLSSIRAGLAEFVIYGKDGTRVLLDAIKLGVL